MNKAEVVSLHLINMKKNQAGNGQEALYGKLLSIKFITIIKNVVFV